MLADVRALAVDPGPKRSYYGLVTHGLRGRARFLACGCVASEAAAFDELLTTLRPTTLAIEWVQGYAHEHKRSAQLIATNGVAGTLRGVAWARGIPLVLVPASAWRAALVGRGNVGDDVVERAVRAFVEDLPRRTNEHTRDALGLAVVALRRTRAAATQVRP